MDKTTSSKPIAVISEWWLVTINYELRIRKTCVDFISVRIKTSIFFPIRVLSLSNFPDIKLIFKCPMINLLTFFNLS